MIQQNNVIEGDFFSSSNKTSSFGMETSAEAFAILSSQIYQFKVAAVVREYMCNACDGHSAIDSTAPFTVRIPTAFDPFFVVIDEGIGLDDDGVRNVFARYFKSTKKATNKETGFLGLGAKSGYSYTDTFTIEARKDGVERIYIAYFDATRIPALDCLSERPTSSPDGVTIKVPVQDSDVNTFRSDVAFIASFTTITPKIEGGELWDDTIRSELDDRGWAFSEKPIPYTTSSLYRLGSRDVGIVMGGVVYPVEHRTVAQLLRDESMSDRENVYLSFFENITKTLFINVGMGEVEFAASRETLSFTPTTKETVKKYVSLIVDEILTEVKAKVESFDSPVPAFNYVQSTLGHVPPLRWRGNTTLSVVHRPVKKLFEFFGSTLLKRDSPSRVRECSWMGTTLLRLYGNIKIIYSDCNRPGLKKYAREYIVDNGSYGKIFIRMHKHLMPSHIRRLKDIFGLTDEDFIKSSDIIPIRKKKAQKSAADETSIRCCWYDVKRDLYFGSDVVDVSKFDKAVYIDRIGSPGKEDERLDIFGYYPSIGPSMNTHVKMMRRDLEIDAVLYMNSSNEKKIKKLGIPSLGSIAVGFLEDYRDDAVKVMAQRRVDEAYENLGLEKYDLLASAKSIHMDRKLPKKIVSGTPKATMNMKKLTGASRNVCINSPDLIRESIKLAQKYIDGMNSFSGSIDSMLFEYYPLLKEMEIVEPGSELRVSQIEYIQLKDQKEKE